MKTPLEEAMELLELATFPPDPDCHACVGHPVPSTLTFCDAHKRFNALKTRLSSEPPDMTPIRKGLDAGMKWTLFRANSGPQTKTEKAEIDRDLDSIRSAFAQADEER